MNIPPDSPNPLHPYLRSTGSLTTLLEQHAGRPLRVQVVCERHEPMDFTHKKLLGLPTNRPAMAWMREVLLHGNDGDTPWVRAKSIFPISSLTGQNKRLRHLKGTPIGYVMFKKKRTIPHTRHFFYADGQCGRTTVYALSSGQIMIQEWFLTDFIESLRLV